MKERSGIKEILVALGKAAAYTLVFVVVQFGVTLVAMTVYGAMQGFGLLAAGGEFMDPTQMIEVISEFALNYSAELLALANAVLVLVLMIFFRTRRKRLSIETQLSPIGVGKIGVSIACAIACAFVIGCGMSLIPFPEAMMAEYEALAGVTLGGTGVIAFLSIVVVAPVAEELVFRGLVYTRLRRALPVAAACLIQSLLFGLMHGVAIWILYAAFLAVVMTVIFERYGSLWASIAFHVAMNLVGSYVLPNLPLETEASLWITLGVSLLVACALMVLVFRQTRKPDTAPESAEGAS